jgi:hypothetical protein
VIPQGNWWITAQPKTWRSSSSERSRLSARDLNRRIDSLGSESELSSQKPRTPNWPSVGRTRLIRASALAVSRLNILSLDQPHNSCDVVELKRNSQTLDHNGASRPSIAPGGNSTPAIPLAASNMHLRSAAGFFEISAQTEDFWNSRTVGGNAGE